MLSICEKEGLRIQPQARRDIFRNFLNATGLIDLELKGCKYTWMSNPRNGVVTRENLDRVLVNYPWRVEFPNAMATALPIISSDHSPLILQVKPPTSINVSFKFEAKWAEHEECEETVREGWLEGMRKESSWKTILEKTKSCRKHLLRWKRRVFKRADVEISQLKARLNILQNSLNANWEEFKSVQQRIEQLWREEELYWGQRLRLKCFTGGDRNTKFFHATTLQRRDRNRIQRIQDSHGNWVEGKEDAFKAVLDHFQGVYSSGDISNVENCLQFVPRLVTEEMNRKLMAPIDE